MTISTGQNRPHRHSYQPLILVDRCLPPSLAESLRKHGHDAKHLRDVYPDDGQWVPDLEWIEDAGNKEWIVLTRDLRLRDREDEFAALQEWGAKIFTITARNATKLHIGMLFGRQLPNIIRRGRKPGPAFWRIRGEQPVGRIIG